MKNYLCFEPGSWWLHFMRCGSCAGKESESTHFLHFIHDVADLCHTLSNGSLFKSAIPVYFILNPSYKGDILHVLQNFYHPWLS